MREEIKKLSDIAILPTRGSTYSACKDLYSPIDCIVPANSNKLVKTDLAIAWENPQYYMQLLSRSGLCYKHNIVVQAGVIDYDYRQNIGILIQNNSSIDFEIKRCDRIAQYTYVKIADVSSVEVNDFTPLEQTPRIYGDYEESLAYTLKTYCHEGSICSAEFIWDKISENINQLKRKRITETKERLGGFGSTG